MIFFRSLLSCCIGIIFLLSGYSKLFPVEPFEITFIEIGIANWNTAPFLARALIILEFFLGTLFLFNLNWKRNAYKLSSGLLIIFTLYLVIILLQKGNSSDCGCFGEILPMTPVQSILKNVVMLAVILYLYYKDHGIKIKRGIALYTVIFILSAAGVFISNVPDVGSAKDISSERTGVRVPLELLYTTPPNIPPDTNLLKGKWVISFLSARCAHCKIAAQKLRVLKKTNPHYPLFIVINGKDRAIEQFFSKTGSSNVPHMRFRGKDQFIKMAGVDLPAIFCLENGVVRKTLTTSTLKKQSIEEWLHPD